MKIETNAVIVDAKAKGDKFNPIVQWKQDRSNDIRKKNTRENQKRKPYMKWNESNLSTSNFQRSTHNLRDRLA